MWDQTGAKPDFSIPETSSRGRSRCWFASCVLVCITGISPSIHPPEGMTTVCFWIQLRSRNSSFNPSSSNFSFHSYKIYHQSKQLKTVPDVKLELIIFIGTSLLRTTLSLQHSNKSTGFYYSLTSLFPILNCLFWLCRSLWCPNSIISGWFYGPSRNLMCLTNSEKHL